MHLPTKQRKSPVPKLSLQAGLGEFLGRTAHRIDTTANAVGQAAVSVAGHRWHQQATQVACFALSLAAGKSPEAIAAEITARVINSLTSKASNPSRP
jgi:hypothetical protein